MTFISMYLRNTEEELREITEYAKSIHFQFASYMSASKFYKDYALKQTIKVNF